MAFIETEITFKGIGDENPLSSDLIFKPLIQVPEVSSLGFDIRTDIVTYKDMYKAISQRKVTRAKSGCGWNPYGKLADLIDERIEVKKMGIEMEQCAEDFDGLILQMAKKLGVERADLTGTQLATVLSALAQESAKADMLRIMFLGDEASLSDDYNQTDGIWKKLFEGVADGNVTKAGAALGNDALPAGAAEGILDDLYYGASMEMQDLDDSEKRFYVTRSIYNNWKKTLTKNKQLESSWTALQNGVNTLTYLGVPLIPLGFVDAAIRQDFAGANPHRALYAKPENVVIGMDQESDYQTVKFWYQEKEEMNYMRLKYKLGTGLGWGEYLAVSY
ncbi:hypothetical protein OB13_15020 [Pontibacter sp. HJ8]